MPSARVRRHSVITGMLQRSAAGLMGVPALTSASAATRSLWVHLDAPDFGADTAPWMFSQVPSRAAFPTRRPGTFGPRAWVTVLLLWPLLCWGAAAGELMPPVTALVVIVITLGSGLTAEGPGFLAAAVMDTVLSGTEPFAAVVFEGRTLALETTEVIDILCVTGFEVELLVSCLARGLRADWITGADDEGGGGAGGGCCPLGSGMATVFGVAAGAALEDEPTVLEAFEVLGGSGNMDGKTGPPPSARKACG